MGMALAAIADDGDLLALDQVQVGVTVVVNTHCISPLLGACLLGSQLGLSGPVVGRVFFPLLLLWRGSRRDKPIARPLPPWRRLAFGLADIVELFARAGDLRLVADRPGAERRYRIEQIAAERGQRIIDPRRNRRID